MSSQSQQALIDSIIQYYTDRNAKNKAPRNPNGTLRLDFGKVIQGRASDIIKLYVRNEHPRGHPVLLEAHANDDDLLFISQPGTLRAGEVGEVALQFNCPVDRISPLSCSWGFAITVLNE